MFNNYPDKTLNAAEHGAVHHNRAFAPFGGHKFQVKAFGQVKVKLDGGQLPQAADGVHDLDVNFRPIESRFPGVGGVGDVVGLQHVAQGVFGPFPILHLTGKVFGVLRVPRGQFHRVFFKAEGFENVHGKLKALFNLVFHLFRRAEDMRIVLRKATHTQQPVQSAGAFVAVDGAQLGIAQGQIAVAAQVGLVNFHMERAVHRFDLVFIAVHFHGVEHTVGVKPGVAADFKQVQARNMRAVHHIVAALNIFLFNPILQHLAQHAALGVH